MLISPISIFEIAQKVRLGKWPEMKPFVDRLPGLLEDQGGTVASFRPTICLMAGTMEWPHRDPSNRLLAATARQDALPLVSADPVFDDIVTRIWQDVLGRKPTVRSGASRWGERTLVSRLFLPVTEAEW